MDGGQSCENALNLNGNKFFKEGQFLFSETLEAFGVNLRYIGDLVE